MLAAGAVGVAGIVGLVVIDPTVPGPLPGCMFRGLTGWDCPGCGVTRALHAVLTGRPLDALDHNLLAMLILPILMVVGLRWARDAWLDRPRRAPQRPALVWTIGVVIVAFWILRNLPGVPYLGSGLG